jgi:hypothetical protein
VRGEMGLSKHLADGLFEVYVKETRSASTRALSFGVGGTWFCPGCACRLSEREDTVICDRCGHSLNEFIYELVELHRHRKISVDRDAE